MNLQNRRIIIQTRGGSHAYGLSTPKSDVDIRGIFINTDAAHLVGLSRDEVLVAQNEEKDEVFTEFRHALRLLMKSANTQMVELLFTSDSDVYTPAWMEVQKQRQYLVGTKTLFNSLRGYIQSELRLANGERTGKLGGKRKEALDAYGFSPKNFVQLLRLAWAGQYYFMYGQFPVNVRNYDAIFAGLLLSIKTEPEKFTRAQLNDMAHLAEDALIRTYENRAVNTEFSEEVATQLCLKIYGPLIESFLLTEKSGFIPGL